MRRPSLRSQLNQIRLWVRQGRTDAWIAHKLDISVEQLEQFKREQHLDGDPPPSPAPLSVDTAPFERDEAPLEDLEDAQPEQQEPDEEEADDEEQGDADEQEAPASRRRRRGRRGGRRRKRTPAYEATFEHGDEGYGLWLDPAVADDDVYAGNWAGHREVTVTVEADVITIRRAGSAEPD